MKPRFFFDTANLDDIKRIWDTVGKYVGPLSICGITTNPNALAKINCNTMAQLELVVRGLSDWLWSIGSDTLIFVQTPHSHMRTGDVIKWAQFIEPLGHNIGIKIPHYTYTLELSEILGQITPVNVTGIADWGTILKAFSYRDVTFASLIPGRMEEAGINANAHMDFITDIRRLHHQEVITGSMRTLEGLKNAAIRNTIPTIGMRVWDLVIQNPKDFPSYWEAKYENDFSEYGPVILETNRQLSTDFFNQMDKLGEPMFKEFVTRDSSF